MTIILTSERINDLINEGVLKILKKSQKNNLNSNYFFTPNIGIMLYEAKVKYVDPKSITFGFDKYKNITLYYLIKHINTCLQNEIRKQHIELNDKKLYDLFSEEDETFYIRCYLPNYNGKYFIKVDDADAKRFYLPKLGCVYNNILVEIRNVWGKDCKYGFNIELKSVTV